MLWQQSSLGKMLCRGNSLPLPPVASSLTAAENQTLHFLQAFHESSESFTSQDIASIQALTQWNNHLWHFISINALSCSLETGSDSGEKSSPLQELS